MTTPNQTDCRSEEGITVGLIDGLLAISRVLAPRLNTMRYSQPVAEALRDYWSDEDVRDVQQAAMGVLRGDKPVNPPA